jgi:D-alanine-D-alanine ligase-like ATP-grasp enzyme
VRKAAGYTIYSKKEKLVQKPSEAQIGHDDKERQRVGEIGMWIATAIGIRGFVRMDAIIDAIGRVHVLDLNTLPGLIPGVCLLPKMSEEAGIDYTQMIGMLVESAGRPQPMHMRKLFSPPPAPKSWGRDATSAAVRGPQPDYSF